MRQFTLLVFFLLAPADRINAQPTNLEVFQTLALECIPFVSETGGAVSIDAPARMPYVRSAIVTQLHKNGRQVFLADSVYTEKPGDLTALRYTIDASQVAYERLRKKRVKRTVSLSMSPVLVSSKGMVLWDDVCSKTSVDTVAVSDLDALASSTYSETQAPPPRAGFGRRILQPLTLTAASALTVYLFFTLRSEGSGDGN